VTASDLPTNPRANEITPAARNSALALLAEAFPRASIDHIRKVCVRGGRRKPCTCMEGPALGRV
jgi:hypothetical protein